MKSHTNFPMLTQEQRFYVFRRDNLTCQYCGAKAPNVQLEVDHKNPKANGGLNEMSNLITACHDCNAGKHAKVIEPSRRIDLGGGYEIIPLSEIEPLDPPKPAKKQAKTWPEICQLEPRLQALLEEIKQVKDDPTTPYFCANAHWYGQSGFKSRIFYLVGHWAENCHLRSSTAYDVAYHKLYDALPNCRNCGNCGFDGLLR
jgi:hypothetical protein